MNATLAFTHAAEIDLVVGRLELGESVEDVKSLPMFKELTKNEGEAIISIAQEKIAKKG